MKKILVVNVNWLGDVIFSSPVFKALKDAYPQAHISCLAVPRVKEILECISEIDEIIEYDEKGRHYSPIAKLRFIFQLRRKRFDTSFLLHRSLTRALLVYCAGIPKRIGYDEKRRGWLLTHRVNPLEGTAHRCDHYLNVIESFGITVGDRNCYLQVPADVATETSQILQSRGVFAGDRVIVLNPGGNWELKRWPAANFTRLIDAMRGIGNCKIIISGSLKDASLASSLNNFKDHQVINLTGQLNLKQFMALIKRADLVVSGDSGPLHIASSIGTTVIGLFGPTRPEITGPRGKGRVHLVRHDLGCNRDPCYHLRCTDNVCMQSITVDHVFQIVEQITNS